LRGVRIQLAWREGESLVGRMRGRVHGKGASARVELAPFRFTLVLRLACPINCANDANSESILMRILKYELYNRRVFLN
jgi:hypothetical protein